MSRLLAATVAAIIAAVEREETPWFPRGTHPHWPGVYRTRDARGTFQHWSGSFWGLRATTPAGAYRMAAMRSDDQAPRWRGRTMPPTP